MQIAVVTLFPELVKPIVEYGVTGRAAQQGSLALTLHNPRDFAQDRRGNVDDRPYGGGPGMLMTVEPLRSAVVAAREAAGSGATRILLSPQGVPLDAAMCTALAAKPGLVLVCGRYEGVDERLIETEIDLEVSIGDYVLSGGEPAAMVLIDAVARWLPGVLGHEDSAEEDSFSNGLLDCQHYSRPEQALGREVPPVLLSGDHAAIARWRLKQALGRTWLRRQDLLDGMKLTADQQALLQEFIAEQECAADQS